jgi:hypothetical protein
MKEEKYGDGKSAIISNSKPLCKHRVLLFKELSPFNVKDLLV